MLTLLEFALQNLLFIGLHLDSRSSFPKQLSPKEEEECIALIAPVSYTHLTLPTKLVV